MDKIDQRKVPFVQPAAMPGVRQSVLARSLNKYPAGAREPELDFERWPYQGDGGTPGFGIKIAHGDTLQIAKRLRAKRFSKQ